MAHRIGEPIAVRLAGRDGVGDEGRAEGVPGAPATFVWRERVYVVREVLGHWRERRAWWASAAARAVHGDATAHEGGRGGLTVAADHEREVWRVEASAGRSYASGVYDLCREAPQEPPVWRLLAVAD